MTLILHECNPPLARITLNHPEKRNAMSLAMFDELEAAIADVAARDDVHVVLLSGSGGAFSAGFDLAAALDDPALPGKLILRLSTICRQLRRLPQVVVAAVEGAAVAGGCAMISACDFVFVTPNAKIGYPVHRIGISPAVSAPTLMSTIGCGRARALQLSGALIDGPEALNIGLAYACSESALDDAAAHCQTLAGHGPHALRTTKAWLNELDGSLDDQRFDPVAQETAVAAGGEETQRLLKAFWGKRK